MSQLSYTFRDYANESSTVGVHIEPVTAANFDAMELAKSSLLTALEAVSLGNYIKGQAVVSIDKESPEPSANPQAQRELKWHVRGMDTVTYDLWGIEIPCADTSLLDPVNQDRMVIGSGPGATLVSEIEATALSKAGNAVEVLEVVLVGRNL